MKTRIAFLSILFAAAAVAHAQSGCVVSPECPTAVLAAVGAGAVAMVRRFKR